MDVLEVVGDADGETLGIERMMMKEVVPKLVFVVAAHPDVPEGPVLQPSARGIEDPGVMLVIRAGATEMEIDAAVFQQKLAVGVDVAEVAPGVDPPPPAVS
jgi:hypothetical protein